MMSLCLIIQTSECCSDTLYQILKIDTVRNKLNITMNNYLLGWCDPKVLIIINKCTKY